MSCQEHPCLGPAFLARPWCSPLCAVIQCTCVFIAAQAASNYPYAHWAWPSRQVAAAAASGCAAAASDYSYDQYRGPLSPIQQANASLYTKTAANKYGWMPADCSVQFGFVCQALASAFPSAPPPSSPPPPPVPPSPPSPPLPPSCAPAANATFFCTATVCYSYLMRQVVAEQARAGCNALSGQVVLYSSMGEQSAVETYFR